MITQFAVKENEIGVCLRTCIYPLFNCCYRSYLIRTLHYGINQASSQCSQITIKTLFCFPCGMMCRLVYTEGTHVGLNIVSIIFLFLPKLKWHDNFSDCIFFQH